jgi:hypothetical protein
MVVLASLGMVFGRPRLHWSGLFFCLVGSLRGIFFFFFSLSLVGLVWVMPRRAVDLYAYGRLPATFGVLLCERRYLCSFCGVFEGK